MRDSYQAGLESVKGALEGLGGKAPDALLIFSTLAYEAEEILRAARELCPAVQICGCSAEGVITQGGSDEGTHVVGVMALASDRVRFDTIHVEGLGATSGEVGQLLAARVTSLRRDDARLLLVFPDGMAFDQDVLLGELQENLPTTIQVVGGVATDAIAFECAFEYSDQRVLSRGVSALLISGPISARTVVTHGCVPIGPVRTVTSSRSKWVFEIDGQPAWQVLKEYLGKEDNELGSSDRAHISLGESVGDDRWVIRTPSSIDGDAVQYPVSIRRDAVVQMVRADPHMTEANTQRAVTQLLEEVPGRKPALVFHFECVGRGRVMYGSQVNRRMIEPVQRIVGKETPWLGFHAAGEIGPLGNQAHLHNFTGIFSAIYLDT